MIDIAPSIFIHQNFQIMETITDNKQKVVQILESFKVGVESIAEYKGSTLTLYEVKPKLGIRISKIRNLKDEIAAAMEVPSVRIIAPMENGRVGIEVPNPTREIIPVAEMLNSWPYRNTDMELPCALGKTVTGETFIADLAEMPHLLVAGATGQGKSVGLNAIIMSLLHKKSPDELKLVLIDPKQVEFSLYEGNTYLATPVITETQKAANALNAICEVMDARYELLAAAKVRNLKEYNEVKPDERLPYIVTIIDEFGDLVMTGGRKMEHSICRIAQKARAVGIHLIVSTQRPSTDIVTGRIKANFPTRIAFRTTTGTDSRVIIDQTGAEKLTGKGDMIFFCGSELTRVQCAFASVADVMDFNRAIAEHYADYETNFTLPPSQMELREKEDWEKYEQFLAEQQERREREERAKAEVKSWLDDRARRKDEIEKRRKELYEQFYGDGSPYYTFIIPQNSRIRHIL